MGHGMMLAGVVIDLTRSMKQYASNAPRGDMQYEFRVAPSCPPDKRLHIRSGIAVPSVRWSAFIEDDYIPYTICDFENQGETDMDLSFTNAGHYLPIILCYAQAWLDDRTEPIFNNVAGTETATALDAEGQIDGFLNGVENWYYERLPLCGVILKNNGYVDVSYAIEPIDAVPRGRSYIYRDARSSGGIFA